MRHGALQRPTALLGRHAPPLVTLLGRHIAPRAAQRLLLRWGHLSERIVLPANLLLLLRGQRLELAPALA
jgi:hypothetical protein